MCSRRCTAKHHEVMAIMEDADVTAAQIGSPDCPDVRTWRIGGHIRRVVFARTEEFERGNVMVEFDGRDALPPANGTQGAISWTLWGGWAISGEWWILPLVECIRTYVPTGALFTPGHVGKNLTYYARGPLARYQPEQNEPTLLFATTGDTRRQNAQAGPEWRTNAVVVPFAIGDWDFGDVTPPPPPPDTALEQRVSAIESALAGMHAALGMQRS